MPNLATLLRNTAAIARAVLAVRRGFAQSSLALCLAAACGSAAAQPATVDIAALEAATKRGDVPAMMALAVVYERGEIVEQDFIRSNALWCRAAARGNLDAMLRLAAIYGSGRAMLPNEGVAGLLVHRAAELGSERAQEILPHISRGVGSVLPECMREPVVEAVIPRAPPVAASKGRRDIALLVQHWAPQYSIDPDLVMALIAVESRFDTSAVSPKNAQGLMQLIPATAARFGVKNVFNPIENLKGGLAYLRWLLAYFKGDVALVLAAYNAGEEAVERHRGIPPYRETRDYVKKITSVYTKASHPYRAELVSQSSILNRNRRTD